MKLATLFIFMSAVLSLASSAAAEDAPPFVGFKSGNSLLEECSAPSGTDALADCWGYVTGVADALGITKFACTPANATARQLVDVVLGRLRSHVAERHYAAVGEVALALRQVFPCQK